MTKAGANPGEADETKKNTEVSANPRTEPIPWGRMALKAILFDQKFATKLPLQIEPDNRSLLDSHSTADHKIQVLDGPKDRTAVFAQRRRLMIAAFGCGVFLACAAVFAVSHREAANNSDQRGDRRMLGALVDSSLESRKLSDQPEESFRRPAEVSSPVNSAPPGAAATSTSAPSGQEQVSTDAPRVRSAASHAHDEQADLALLTDEQKKALRLKAKSASMYAAVLEKNPDAFKLRILTVRAYLDARQYSNARQLCMSGLARARTAEETASIKALLRSIPQWAMSD